MPQADAAAFAAESGAVPTLVENPSVVTPPIVTEAIAAANQSAKFYTEEDLAKVRAQEKDKLYPQIDALKEEISSLKKDKEERAARKAAEAEAAAAEKAEKDRKKQEEELSAKELLDLRQQEWEQKLLAEKQEREKAFALLEQERMFTDIQNYRNQRLEAERDNIMPELLDMVTGNSREEIDASLAALAERTQRIIDSVKQNTSDARRQMVGTRTTFPTTGPLDTESGPRQFTAADIASMSMAEYAKYRESLLSDNARGRQSGLFG